MPVNRCWVEPQLDIADALNTADVVSGVVQVVKLPDAGGSEDSVRSHVLASWLANSR